MSDFVAPIDWARAPIDPDPDFDPEHNMRVIEETIRENDLLAAQKKRESHEGARERSEVLARYYKSLADGKTSSTFLKYMGNHELARLRGKEILNKLKGSDIGEKIKARLAKKIKNTKPGSIYGHTE